MSIPQNKETISLGLQLSYSKVTNTYFGNYTYYVLITSIKVLTTSLTKSHDPPSTLNLYSSPIDPFSGP